MASLHKTFDHVISGASERRLLRSFGFAERVSGDHHIYSRDGVEEIINLQPLAGGKAKPYQVKQVRQMISRYKLTLRDDDET